MLVSVFLFVCSTTATFAGPTYDWIELRWNSSVPFIDFSNDTSIDFDARLILMSNDRLNLQGANLTLQSGYKIGVGTVNPSYPLEVNGTIRAKELIVETGWSDFVFEPDYDLWGLARKLHKKMSLVV